MTGHAVTDPDAPLTPGQAHLLAVPRGDQRRALRRETDRPPAGDFRALAVAIDACLEAAIETALGRPATLTGARPDGAMIPPQARERSPRPATPVPEVDAALAGLRDHATDLRVIARWAQSEAGLTLADSLEAHLARVTAALAERAVVITQGREDARAHLDALIEEWAPTEPAVQALREAQARLGLAGPAI